MSKKAQRLEKEDYSLEINYSESAIAKKLIKFIPKEGTEFEISAEDIISFLVNQVSMNTLEPTLVDTEKINIVDVYREIKVKLDRDFKEGEIIQLGYKTPYPLEFAVIESIYNIAKVEEGAEVFSLTSEMIEKYKKQIKPEQDDFVKKFYAGHKGLKLGETKI